MLSSRSKVTNGEPFEPSAETHNAIIDAVLRRTRNSDKRALREELAYIPITVKTTDQRNVAEVVGFADPSIIVDSTDLSQEESTFEYAAPKTGSWAVAVSGIQTNEAAECVLVGLAWTQVDIQSDAHGWADINDAGDLVSTVGGYAKILYKPTGTGLKWCALQLGFGGGKKPRLGKADADVAKDASGTFTIQIGEPGSLVASTETETAFALCAIKLGDVVALIEVDDGAGGCFYLALSCGTGSAECICALDAMLQIHKGLIDALDARVTVLEP